MIDLDTDSWQWHDNLHSWRRPFTMSVPFRIKVDLMHTQNKAPNWWKHSVGKISQKSHFSWNDSSRKSRFWIIKKSPLNPLNKDPQVWNVPVRTYTKMAAIHHGFLFGLAFFHAFSMASKATTTTAMTPGLFCVNKSFGTSTAMRDRRQRRHWQLLSSSCWSSLFLWPCRAFISLYFHDLTWIKRAKRASFTIFKFTKLISFKTQKFKNMNSQ